MLRDDSPRNILLGILSLYCLSGLISASVYHPYHHHTVFVAVVATATHSLFMTMYDTSFIPCISAITHSLYISFHLSLSTRCFEYVASRPDKYT